MGIYCAEFFRLHRLTIWLHILTNLQRSKELQSCVVIICFYQLTIGIYSLVFRSHNLLITVSLLSESDSQSFLMKAYGTVGDSTL